jgi:hypothetical protein
VFGAEKVRGQTVMGSGPGNPSISIHRVQMAVIGSSHYCIYCVYQHEQNNSPLQERKHGCTEASRDGRNTRSVPGDVTH